MADTTDEELKLKAEAFRLLKLNVEQNKKKRLEDELELKKKWCERYDVLYEIKKKRLELAETEIFINMSIEEQEKFKKMDIEEKVNHLGMMETQEEMRNHEGFVFMIENKVKEVLQNEKDDFCIGDCGSYLPHLQQLAITFFDAMLRQVLYTTDFCGRTPTEVRDEVKEKITDFKDDFYDIWYDYTDNIFHFKEEHITHNEAMCLIPMMMRNGLKHKKNKIDGFMCEITEGISDTSPMEIGWFFFEIVTEKLEYNLILTQKDETQLWLELF